MEFQLGIGIIYLKIKENECDEITIEKEMIQPAKFQSALTNSNQILIIFFGTFLFLVLAIWNGFPFIFTDTLSYITSGIELIAPFDRPIFYGLFIRATGAIVKVWGEAIFQSALLSILLLKLSNILFPKMPKGYLYLWFVLIALFTSVPWFVGQISPDIFTPILFLALIIWALIFQESKIFNSIFIGAVITLSICVHSSNLLIGALTSIAITFWLVFQGIPWVALRKFVMVLGVSLFAAIFLIIPSNIWSHYGVTLNPTGKVFILARMLEDGPGLKYLRDICTSSELKTCASLPILEKARLVEVQDPDSKSPELRNLVASSFLWGGGLALSGGIFSVNSEAGTIIKGALKTYPLEQIGALIRNMSNQLITFSVGEQLNSTLKMEAINQLFSIHFPELYTSYLNSQQSLGKIKEGTLFLNPIYFYVVIFSTISLLGYSLFLMRSAISHKELSLTIYSLFVFLLTNALVSGGLSGVFDRYQSRVVWLLPAICILLMLGLLNTAKNSDNDINTVTR